MSGVYYYLEEIEYLLEDYRKILRELKNNVAEEKISKTLPDVNSINERIKTAKDAYFIEVKNLPEKEQNIHVSKIKGKMTALENLNVEYDFLKNKLFYENKDNKNEKMPNQQMHTAKELEIRGDLIQDKTEASINRMKQMVNESEQITKDAAEKMNVQNEKLMEVTDKVDDVEINVAHAKQTVREIAKSTITDRFVRILAFLIILFLIALITIIALPKT